MSASDLQAIVLAAGKSSRFKTEKSKLAEKICGQEMILYVTKFLEELKIPTTAVVGYQRELIKKIIKKHHNNSISFIVQEKQEGTGHAILCAKDSFTHDNILIINGDTPLIPKDVIEQLYQKHIETNATISLVIAHNSDPATGAYGRIIKNEEYIEIVEATDFSGDMEEHCFINAGIYIVKRTFLEEYVNKLTTNNGSNEFYITDLVKMASKNGYTLNTVAAPFDRVRGINTFRELWIAEQIKRSDIIRSWMERGVRFSLAQSVHIDWDVKIGAGTSIECSVHIHSGTRIGKNCVVSGFSSFYNAIVDDNTTIYPHSIIQNCRIGKNAKIGPFAYVHENSSIGDNTVIGNFVEIRKTTIGNDSRAKHHTYLAHAKIGNNVKIGAGTTTCNFDGTKSHETIIEDNAFIGYNNSLVAPVKVGKNAATVAGSTITQNVPENALAIGRPGQINELNYCQQYTSVRSSGLEIGSTITPDPNKNNETTP